MLTLKRFSTCTAIVLASATLAAAQLGQAQQRQKQNPQPRQRTQQRQQQPKGDVVAMVNGEAIMQAELEARMPSPEKAKKQRDPRKQQQLKQQVLNNLIESRLVEQYVLEEGPGAKQNEVQSVLSRFKQRLKSRGQNFEQFLASRGQTKKQFKKRIAGSIAWQKYQKKQLTPQKLRSYYKSNKKRFRGDSFEKAKQQVTQAYMGKLWDDILQEMKPQAEIRVLNKSQNRKPSESKPSLPGQRQPK